MENCSTNGGSSIFFGYYGTSGRDEIITFFSNIDIDPRDTLKLAETESLLWTGAHVSLTQRIPQNIEVEATNLPIIPDRWCFTDGSSKDDEIF